jgi:hypothetical protein
VAGEVGWFDWDARSRDSGRSHGVVPRDDGRRRGDARWYQAFAEALAQGLVADPAATGRRLLAPHCTVEFVGEGRCDDLTAAMEPVRWIAVNEVAAAGAVLAVLFTAGDGDRVSRGTVVLTLDGQDRIVGLRAYWRWASAVPVDAIHPSVHLGLARSPHLG